MFVICWNFIQGWNLIVHVFLRKAASIQTRTHRRLHSRQQDMHGEKAKWKRQRERKVKDGRAGEKRDYWETKRENWGKKAVRWRYGGMRDLNAFTCANFCVHVFVEQQSKDSHNLKFKFQQFTWIYHEIQFMAMFLVFGVHITKELAPLILSHLHSVMYVISYRWQTNY